jgi:hypothetical protein
MFEKLSEIAERSATSASRRQFLGRVGRGAMTTAAVMGGLLAFPEDAQAARRAKRCGGQICPPGYEHCCSYFDREAHKRVHYCCTGPG